MNLNLSRMGFILIIVDVFLAIALFVASRGDASLRIAALVAVTGLITNIMAIASTMTIGKDITHPDPLPPNTTATTTTATQVTQTSPPTAPVSPK